MKATKSHARISQKVVPVDQRIRVGSHARLKRGAGYEITPQIRMLDDTSLPKYGALPASTARGCDCRSINDQEEGTLIHGAFIASAPPGDTDKHKTAPGAQKPTV